MTKEAKILEEAINLINPKKLSEEALIENLRKRIVTELNDSTVNAKLEKLDSEYFTNGILSQSSNGYTTSTTFIFFNTYLNRFLIQPFKGCSYP